MTKLLDDAIDWLGLWALSLSFCAVVRASIAYFLGGDNIGASFILVAAAGIVTLTFVLVRSRKNIARPIEKQLSSEPNK